VAKLSSCGPATINTGLPGVIETEERALVNQGEQLKGRKTMTRSQKFRLVLGMVVGVMLAPGLALAQSIINPIHITSCPFAAIIAGGHYVVTGNLSSSGDCIHVSAQNVTINLGGFTLTGSGSSGSVGVFIFPSANNASVSNGTVTNFGFGVTVEANGALLTALQANSNTETGVYFVGATVGSLTNGQMSSNVRYGVVIQSSQYISVNANSIASNGTDGVLLTLNSSLNTIAFNYNLSSNGYAGILVADTDNLGNPPPTPASCTSATVSEDNSIFSNSGTPTSPPSMYPVPNGVLGIGLQCGVALSNSVRANIMSGITWGGYDGNLSCDANVWGSASGHGLDTFNSVNQSCVR
jgi:hypothetical protein